MNKFVYALLATVAYSKYNLAEWTSADDFGYFYSDEIECALLAAGSDSTCSYYGFSYAAGEAYLSWGLSNYWNDGTGETDAVFEASLSTEAYLEYTFEFVTKYFSFDVAVGVVGWDVSLFDNLFHVFVEDWSTCDKM